MWLRFEKVTNRWLNVKLARWFCCDLAEKDSTVAYLPASSLVSPNSARIGVRIRFFFRNQCYDFQFLAVTICRNWLRLFYTVCRAMCWRQRMIRVLSCSGPVLYPLATLSQAKKQQRHLVWQLFRFCFSLNSDQAVKRAGCEAGDQTPVLRKRQPGSRRFKGWSRRARKRQRACLKLWKTLPWPLKKYALRPKTWCWYVIQSVKKPTGWRSVIEFDDNT